MDLTSIYEKIYEMENDNSIRMVKDILNKYRYATESFDELEEGCDKEFLVKFSFVCLLAFDVYIKKTMLEKLIDESLLREFVSSEEEENSPNKK
jgi:hypothetical protein